MRLAQDFVVDLVDARQRLVASSTLRGHAIAARQCALTSATDKDELGRRMTTARTASTDFGCGMLMTTWNRVRISGPVAHGQGTRCTNLVRNFYAWFGVPLG